MEEMTDGLVLCGASAYTQKFFFNPDFESLPQAVVDELQAMCVLFTEDVGGVLLVSFTDEGNLVLKVDHEETDFSFDEIGSVLKIKQLQQTKRELFEALETYYKVFVG